VDFGKLFSFDGRISRSTYWGIILLQFGAFIAYAFIAIPIRIVENNMDGGASVILSAFSGLLSLAFGLAWVVISLASQVKRWHDRDKSGWWLLITFVPFIGSIWAFIELGCLAGTDGRNSYGFPSSGSPFGQPANFPQSPQSPYPYSGTRGLSPATWAPSAAPALQPPPRRTAEANEHYLLGCTGCDFVHHIPRDYVDGGVSYSVNINEVRLVYVYEGQFTATLGVGEFFEVMPVPTVGETLHPSLRDTMNVLHSHMLSHWDPLFLIIQQTWNTTSHDYRIRAAGQTYVRFSRDRGTEVIGNIDVSKAEIPGLSR
jgi:uncharacterized membrane protein YhaH (DUF805 family)